MQHPCHSSRLKIVIHETLRGASVTRTRKTAIVTGGSGGIGQACGRVLAARGYDVLLVARRAEPLKAVASAVPARWLAADCTNEKDIERIIAAAPAPAILVHAAGVAEGASMREHPPELFDRVIDANLRSTFLLTRGLV